MCTYIYPGCMNIVKKSGVGQAALHQKGMLEAVGTDVTMEDYDRADVVHLNTIFPDSPLVALKARRHGKKVIYYGHSTMEDFKNSFIGSNFFAGLFKRWIKFCYSTGDIIITPTEYSKSLLESYGINKKIYAVSNGVDTELFRYDDEAGKRFRQKYNIKENEKAVISVGHLIERKGILDYIEIAENMPDVKFFWFGYTDKRIIPKNIKRAIDNAPENLVFPGYINQDELIEAYCGCDMFVFASHEETEGIVVLEALSCGTPTIVRDIPVYDKWLVDGQNIYKANSSQEFEELIREYFVNFLSDLTEEERRVANERSLENMGKKLTEIYMDIDSLTLNESTHYNK